MTADPTWRHVLTAAEVAELDGALAGVEAVGLEIIDIGADDFVLPTLAGKLRAIRGQVLEGRGFKLLSGVPVERYSKWQAAAVYWGIGAHIGQARSQNGKGHLLGHVCDLGLDVTDPKTRIYQTTSRQSYHTDSCDIVALLCLRKAKSGGLSSLVSAMTVYNEMLARWPESLEVLFRPIATDRRGEVPEGQKPYFEIPVLNDCEGLISVLYQRKYIDSARRLAGVPALSAEVKLALDRFDSLLEDPAIHLDMAFEPGDIQLVCNHLLLHDRGHFEDWPELDRRRHLLRLWLCPPEARPLPPVYAARYGGTEVGDRGGVIVADTKLCVPLDPE